jgi:two-component system C4-dicarboxylate transport response regulator DctD
MVSVKHGIGIPMRQRIVVAEDDAATLYAMQRTLEMAGYEVAPYGVVMDAWDALRDDARVDLLLADVRFPERQTHGLALARHARFHHPQLPVVFLTGFPDLAAQIPSDLGAVLLKPVDSVRLLAAVQAALATAAAKQAQS